MSLSASILFGESQLSTRRNYQKIDDSVREDETRQENDDDKSSHRPTGIAQFFFGFMYEEELDETVDDILYRSTIEPTTNVWNSLNLNLCIALMFSSAAIAIPVTVLGEASESTLLDGTSASSFATRATAAAVMGTSAGKFLNGPIPDVLGARRTSTTFSILLALALICLASTTTPSGIIWSCFMAEFCYSVQWPCVVVTLATHYRGDSRGMYEGGIHLMSLAARMGSLIGIPVASTLLRHMNWRFVALLGAWLSLLSASVAYLYVSDSPGEPDAPQNPIDLAQSTVFFAKHYRRNKGSGSFLRRIARWIHFVFQTIFLPSMKHVLCSGTFWLVSLAHTGSSIIRSSERILGAYLYDTSDGSLSSSRSSGLAVFLSVGIVAGLLTAGSIFGTRQERERKWLVSKLYMVSIVSCYILAILSVPIVRNAMAAPDLVATFQVMAIAIAGFGIAVQFYHIPSLVCATFGCDKALAVSYVDGVACAVSAVVWNFVGDTVHKGGPHGGGWAYGWAAVALFLLVTSVLMVEFMEHYFCRPRHGGAFETIILA
eukprot:scaffold1049_cov168-Amphora_coffeaeformis.AAC.8